MTLVLFVCKVWSQIMIPHYYDLTYGILISNRHLKTLIEEGRSADDEYQPFYTECATWKPALCYDTDDEVSGGEEIDTSADESDSSTMDIIVKDGLTAEDEKDKNITTKEEKECKLDKRLPFGSPLCKGTIEDQFYLVQDKLTCSEYRKLVETKLGTIVNGPLYINPHLFYDQIEHEKGQVHLYTNEHIEACRREGTGPIVVGNFSGCPIYNDDEYYENYQATDYGLIFYALRGGMFRLMKRAGVKLYEPIVIEDSIYLLRKFIANVLKVAYETKFEGKTEELQFKEDPDQYDQWYPDPEYDGPYCNDNIDADLKLNQFDIIDAVRKAYNFKLFFGEEIDPYNIQQYEQITSHEDDEMKQENEDETICDKSDTSAEESNAEQTLEEHYSEDVDEESIDSDEEYWTSDEEEETLESNMQSSKVLDFIDDSGLDNLQYTAESVFGDSLQDQLLKVSMQVHEEVYGKERTHSEKLYFKNWYGYGMLFFTYAAKSLGDDNPQEEEIIDGESLFESDIIMKDKKEDEAYFGYSIYEDEEDEFPILLEESTDDAEQADEESSREYHLRRLLRERSYDCILNHFNELDSL